MSENGLKTGLLWIGGNSCRTLLSKKVLGELALGKMEREG
jgi:hypothetical protein